MTCERPVIVAIVGGSGSGKTWLSRQIASAFPTKATTVSLDDFYRDRSHLENAQRCSINYDEPCAIEWDLLKEFLQAFRSNLPTQLPRYEFATHCRDPHGVECAPTPLLLIEGLWLLTDPEVRAMFDLSIFLDCPKNVRLERRLARDVVERGRTVEEVRRQFESVVAPMHHAHVDPQRRFADVVLHDPISDLDVEAVVGRVSNLICGEMEHHEAVAAGTAAEPWAQTEWRNVA
jgi:uridine kinase